MMPRALCSIFVCVALLAGCSEEPPQTRHEAPQAWATSSNIHFQDPVSITIVQRHSEPIPGLEDRARIHIGDITGGRVLVEVMSVDGDALMAQVSMMYGSVRRFTYQGHEYAIHLSELHNLLSGDDYATFTVGRIAEPDPDDVANAGRLTESIKIARSHARQVAVEVR